MKRRTRLVIGAALVLSAIGGWWFVLEPMVARPVAQVPDVDLDSARAQARSGSSAALSSRRAGASGVAASGSATAASANADKARCGEDQLPVYKDPQPDPDDGMVHMEMATPDPDGVVRHMPGEIKPAGVGYTGAQRRIDAALRATGDPFDRSVADWLNVDGLRTPAAQLDAIVQDAVDTDDARSYALAFETCNSMTPIFLFSDPRPTSNACARLNVAEWVRRDPGNGVPWVYALQRANQSGDVAAQREAMQRLAASARFDQRFGAGPAAVARLQVPDDADLAAQVDLTMRAVGVGGFVPLTEVTQRCRDKAGGDRDLAQLCDQIAILLFDHADTQHARAIGGSVHKLATGDASWLDRAHREQSALAASGSALAASGPCGSERALLRDVVHRGQVGELAALRERAGVSAAR